MLAAALPYFHLPAFAIGRLQPYGLIVLAALVVGGLAFARAAKQHAGWGGDVTAPLALVLIAAAAVCAHLFDVAVSQRADAAIDPSLWYRIDHGVALFGALIGLAFVTLVWSSASNRELAKLADAVALGWVVALVIGRVGCALVHDHPGVPTSLPIGIDFPSNYVSWYGFETSESTIRLHDVGFEELLFAIPLAIGAWKLAPRLRPGMTAAIVAAAYAVVRFGLDFLRLSRDEPMPLGLTVAQLGCIVMAALAAIALVQVRARPGTG
jgi:phosphatidylglycerol:prolipoprotein diacylglycerol transferase